MNDDDYVYIDLGEYLKLASNIDLLKINRDSLIIKIPRLDPHQEISLMMPATKDAI